MTRIRLVLIHNLRFFSDELPALQFEHVDHPTGHFVINHKAGSVVLGPGHSQDEFFIGNFSPFLVLYINVFLLDLVIYIGQIKLVSFCLT